GDLPLLLEVRVVVDEQEDPRHRRVRQLPVLTEVRRVHPGECGRAPVQLLAEGAHETLDAFRIVTVDDRAYVRQTLQHAQGAGGEVQAVHLGGTEVWSHAGSGGDRLQCGGLA